MDTIFRAATTFEVTSENGETRARSYVFRNHIYCKIDWNQDKSDDKLLGQPLEIDEYWLSLKELGFEKIDAILPIPGHESPIRAYVFSGDRYGRIEYLPGDKRVSGPKKITDGWPKLAEVGFQTIDEAVTRLVVGDGWNITYFFSGNRYCQVKWKETEDKTELLLLDGGVNVRDIKDGWPQPGFTRIDAIMPFPDRTWAYAFSGDHYARIALVDSPPHKGTEARPVQNWQSLIEAKFY
ncbi:Hemopexin-like domain-containing protein [Rhizoctonia solani]|nr:Hemopexin-like domain-containing protein [Rhizoctonia solani]